MRRLSYSKSGLTLCGTSELPVEGAYHASLAYQTDAILGGEWHQRDVCSNLLPWHGDEREQEEQGTSQTEQLFATLA